MNESTNTQVLTEDMAHAQVAGDLKNAVLIVSIVVNLAVFTTWLTIQFA